MTSTLQSVANSRKTIGMSGSGFIEMLARQMTADLQAIRDATAPGTRRTLVSRGILFGSIARYANGAWDTSAVDGLPAPSLASGGSSSPPSLVIRPFHQAGAVVSIREFTNSAFNHHHGIQSVERFGAGDPDGDGFSGELSRAEVTAATLFQAAMPVPSQVVPADLAFAQAVHVGEQRFTAAGCAACHVPRLPLDNRGWIYTEPNPYNPAGTLRPGDAPMLSVDLTSDDLPPPRLRSEGGVVWVPAFTDLKLHDITEGPADPNMEALDQNQPAGFPGFFGGNSRFITRKLWGVGNQAPYFHHGQFTTLREAIAAHAGEARASQRAFQALSPYEQDSVIEFLKSLQVLP